MDPYKLEGFFHSRIGRHWDEVYSELAALKRKRSPKSGRCFGFGLYPKIAHNTWRGESGKIYSDNRSGPEEIGTGWRYSRFYVDPDTRLLCLTQRVKDPSKIKPLKRISIDNDSEFCKIAGIWYYLKYGEEALYVWKDHDASGRSVFEYAPLKYRVILRKRQLSKKDLKHLGISNARR